MIKLSQLECRSEPFRRFCCCWEQWLCWVLWVAVWNCRWCLCASSLSKSRAFGTNTWAAAGHCGSVWKKYRRVTATEAVAGQVAPLTCKSARWTRERIINQTTSKKGELKESGQAPRVMRLEVLIRCVVSRGRMLIGVRVGGPKERGRRTPFPHMMMMMMQQRRRHGRGAFVQFHHRSGRRGVERNRSVQKSLHQIAVLFASLVHHTTSTVIKQIYNKTTRWDFHQSGRVELLNTNRWKICWRPP